MKPFPRQEMLAAGWSPALIEYLYQLDLAIRNGSLFPDSEEAGEGFALALPLDGIEGEPVMKLGDGHVESEPLREVRLVDHVESEFLIEVHDLRRRVASLEGEVL